MTAFSKLDWTECSILAHPWNPNCNQAYLELFRVTFRSSVAFYLLFHLAPPLAKRRKFTKQLVKELPLRIVRGICFMTGHITGYVILCCQLRKLLGRYHYYTAILLPTFLASFSFFAGDEAQREFYTKYKFNLAMDQLLRYLQAEGIINLTAPRKIFAFMLTSATLLFMLRSNAFKSDGVYRSLSFLLPPESVTSKKEKPTPTPPSPLCSEPSNGSKKGLRNVWKAVLRKIYAGEELRSEACSHEYNCLHFAARGILNLFILGYSLAIVQQMFTEVITRTKHKGFLKRFLFSVDHLNLGAFLGGFVGLYRLSNCTLCWLRKKDSKYHAIPAGFLAGLSFYFQPSSTILISVLVQIMQMLYQKGVSGNYLPVIPGSQFLMYGISSSSLFHASILRPKICPEVFQALVGGLSGGKSFMITRTVQSALKNGQITVNS